MIPKAWGTILLVDRSITATGWVDGMETAWTEPHVTRRARLQWDHVHQLAKVRAAGSKPVPRPRTRPLVGPDVSSFVGSVRTTLAILAGRGGTAWMSGPSWSPIA